MRLHPAGGIDRIAPKVVGEFLLANDSGHDRPSVNADADGDGGVVTGVESLDHLSHTEGQFGGGLGMIAARLRETGDGHIGVANGLDLFQPKLRSKNVERAKNLVEDVNKL